MQLLVRVARLLLTRRQRIRVRRALEGGLTDRLLILERRLEATTDQLRTAEAEARTGRAATILVAAAGMKDTRLLNAAEAATSQLGQDLFALHCSGYREGGFFVEFGAGDGVRISNTYLLETMFGWQGILAEPLPAYHDLIRTSRSAAIDHRVVWKNSGSTLNFIDAGLTSTIEAFKDGDMHAKSRARRETHAIETVSLSDLLRDHGAPRQIDFLSIDTEGSEFEILSAFPFGKEFTIRAIACEHNFTEDRERIHALLSRNGYRRVGVRISRHDDWYVLDDEVSRRYWRDRED